MKQSKISQIGLGGSCHWCTEAIFQSIIGITKVKQGWIASDKENDSLSEAILFEFDENIIPLKIIIEIHLNTHSCTSNHSMRLKYRSAIYFFTSKQEKFINLTITDLQSNYKKTIITKILPFKNFKLNIEKQINYYYSNPKRPFCKIRINPKLQILLKKYSSFVNSERQINLS